ncbi:MAG: aminoacyl-tRNA hydrolase [Legionellales bacterium]|nr:aminoacyl-tRNA hydrolase [Legionellales bacterium]
MSIQLLVGLNNPGPQYARTRHNAGAWLVQQWAQREHLTFRFEKKFHGEYATYMHGATKVHVLLPNTYMNHSGDAIQAIAHFYKLPPQSILVAHDELDLPAGVCKLKTAGGHGGHNGLRDVIEHLGGEFHRLRIGIGHPGHRDRVLDYVLTQPNQADRQHIDHAIEQVLSVMDPILAGQMQLAMNQLHTLNPSA